MRELLIFFLLGLLPFISFGQTPVSSVNDGTIKSDFKNKVYGVQFVDEIELYNKYITIDEIKIVKLKDKYRKDYYNNYPITSNYWETDKARSIIVRAINNSNKCEIIVPPLKPNSFYKVEYRYYTPDNIINIVRMIHDEGNADWIVTQKNWMKLYKQLNESYGDLLLTYRPLKKDLKKYRNVLQNFNLNSLSAAEKIKLKDQTLEIFPNLKFSDVKDKYNKLDKSILEYAKYLKATASTETSDNQDEFEKYFACLDYVGIYNFYAKHLSVFLSNYEFDHKEYIKKFNEAISVEKAYYNGIDEAEPNSLNSIEKLSTKDVRFSTFTISFEKSYRNAIVPDFGYVVFSNLGNEFNGGAIFVGANISLQPSNKDVPLQISDLTLGQRVAIHTGITLNSIDKGNNQRLDLFNSSSLLMGISYKIFNHAYRINVGGLVYRQVDAVTRDKSFAVAPYIGISIDFEIRKWINSVFSDLD